MHRFLQAFLAGLTCCLLGACALLSKAEPRVPRYFTPERATSGSTAASTAAATGGMRQLRLGNVRGSSELQERIMYRASPHEVGYHDGLRWTQRPEVFLRRALAWPQPWTWSSSPSKSWVRQHSARVSKSS